MTAEDPLLAALADAAQRKCQAAQEIRLLLAFAREISAPRPYRLADLAQAAGMSISGVRTGYTQRDIVFAAHMTNGYGGPDLHWVTVTSSLLARHAARERHRTAA